MNATTTASAAAGLAFRGFTLVELVGILLLVGILSVVALPRLFGGTDFEAMAFRDQVAAALRHAHKTAVSRRRLVCADVATGSVTLRVAGSHPASTCGAVTIDAPDGQSPYARSDGARIVSGTGTLHFQPSGRVTTSAGAVSDFSIVIEGEAPVLVTGVSGHVE